MEELRQWEWIWIVLELMGEDRHVEKWKIPVHLSNKINNAIQGWALLWISDISHIFFSLYFLDKETQRNTYLNPCSEFILIFLDIIYSQMTPFHERSFLLKLKPLSF